MWIVNGILLHHNIEKQMSDSRGEVAYLMADISDVKEEEIRDLFQSLQELSCKCSGCLRHRKMEANLGSVHPYQGALLGNDESVVSACSEEWEKHAQLVSVKSERDARKAKKHSTWRSAMIDVGTHRIRRIGGNFDVNASHYLMLSGPRFRTSGNKKRRKVPRAKRWFWHCVRGARDVQ